MPETIVWLSMPKPYGPTDDTGQKVPGGSDIPVMRARTGKNGSNKELVKLLDEALEDLAKTACTFWACDGPNRPRAMITCNKCCAMRNIATVKASLEARE